MVRERTKAKSISGEFATAQSTLFVREISSWKLVVCSTTALSPDTGRGLRRKHQTRGLAHTKYVPSWSGSPNARLHPKHDAAAQGECQELRRKHLLVGAQRSGSRDTTGNGRARSSSKKSTAANRRRFKRRKGGAKNI